jgi:hypothetical protein
VTSIRKWQIRRYALLSPYVETPGLKAYLILAAKQCGHLQMVFDEKDW